jgi:flavin reductase (DIM6/NTAB) family NADH-FMN oxidoreductase RutF
VTSSPVASRASEPTWFRRVLGQYPTGVSVVTGVDANGEPAGLAVGSFTSVSLDPPLVAFLPAKESSSWPKIAGVGKFCVNILASDQEAICRVFASKATDKFAGLRWRPAATGSPILEGTVAWIDCHLEAVHDAGDHLIVVGRVRDLEIERPSLPLLFFQGGYGRFSPLSLAVRDMQLSTQLRLVDRARPLMEALAGRAHAQVIAMYCDYNEVVLLASAGTPTDARVSPAWIGQRLPCIPPVGIMWMAFAEPARVDEWLNAVASSDLGADYRRALARIHECRYSVGLATVHSEIEALIERRSRSADESTAEERRLIGGLGVDPLDYAPGGNCEPQTSARADVISLQAPVFTREKDTALGLILTGFPRDGQPPGAHVEDLLELTERVSELAGS